MIIRKSKIVKLWFDEPSERNIVMNRHLTRNYKLISKGVEEGLYYFEAECITTGSNYRKRGKK